MPSAHGDTALIFASANGHTGVVKALIRAGASVNQMNEGKQTALLKAADDGHAGTVKVLLEGGATGTNLEPQH